MAVRFLGKNPRRKNVRPIPNRNFKHVVTTDSKKTENVVKENQENKIINEDKDMADKRLEKIEQLMGAKAPKRKVKVERKDKGLIERTENSTILLTEDNKMLLND